MISYIKKYFFPLFVSIFLAFFTTNLRAIDLPKIKLMFLYNISSGSIKKVHNHYLLTVYNSRYVVAFSQEQEYKYAETITVKNYVEALERTLNVKNHPKNAALVFIKPVHFFSPFFPKTKDIEIKKIIVTINSIKYFPKHHKIVYSIDLLKTDSSLKGISDLKFKEGVLFVDGACAVCGGENF